MKLIDCPKCGHPLERAQGQPSGKVSCPSCGGRFVLANANSSQPSPARHNIATRPAGEASAVTPTAFESSHRKPDELLPPPSKSPSAGNGGIRSTPKTNQHSPPEISIATNSRPTVAADTVLLQAEIRRIRNQRLAIFYVAILVIACGIAIYLVINPSGRKNQNEITSAELVPAIGDTNSAPTANNDDSPANFKTENPSPDEIQAEPPKPIAWSESRNVSTRDLEKLWAQLQPYALKLVARHVHGDRVLTGVVVDSRGWIVTSLSAIQGAKSIMATTAPTNPLSEESSEQLSDEVRGVLAIDRHHDLVLLQVNRRLVNFITTLQSTDKMLVGGRTLVQIAAVGPERHAWLTECRVNSEVKRDKFDDDLSQQMDRMQLDLSPYWPAHDFPLATGPGGPLFTSDGKLAGINIGLSRPKQNFFVEARWLEALVKTAKEPAASLDSLIPQHAKAVSAASGEADVDYSKGSNPFPLDHPAYAISLDLAERGMVCETFGWQPASPERQADLQSALLAIREANLQIRERKLIRADADLLRSQLEFWSNRMGKTILRNDEAKQLEQNQQAIGDLLDGAPTDDEKAPPIRAALFVQVILQPGSSPRLADQDSVTLKAVGMPDYLVLPIDNQTATMLPDSTWLVVVEIEPGNVATVTNGTERISAKRGSRLWEIAEVRAAGLFGPPIPKDKSDQDSDRAEDDNDQ